MLNIILFNSKYIKYLQINQWITINNEKSNTFLQETYNELIQNIDLLSLPCSCTIKGHLIKHGSYKRTIKSKGKSFAIGIQRVEIIEYKIDDEDLVCPFKWIIIVDMDLVLIRL